MINGSRRLYLLFLMLHLSAWFAFFKLRDFLRQRNQSNDVIGEVVSQENEVNRKTSSDWLWSALQNTDHIYSNDYLRTQSESRLAVKTTQKGELILGENTLMQMKWEQGQLLALFTSGELILKGSQQINLGSITIGGDDLDAKIRKNSQNSVIEVENYSLKPMDVHQNGKLLKVESGDALILENQEPKTNVFLYREKSRSWTGIEGGSKRLLRLIFEGRVTQSKPLSRIHHIEIYKRNALHSKVAGFVVKSSEETVLSLVPGKYQYHLFDQAGKELALARDIDVEAIPTFAILNQAPHIIEWNQSGLDFALDWEPIADAKSYEATFTGCNPKTPVHASLQSETHILWQSMKNSLWTDLADPQDCPSVKLVLSALDSKRVPVATKELALLVEKEKIASPADITLTLDEEHFGRALLKWKQEQNFSIEINRGTKKDLATGSLVLSLTEVMDFPTLKMRARGNKSNSDWITWRVPQEQLDLIKDLLQVPRLFYPAQDSRILVSQKGEVEFLWSFQENPKHHPVEYEVAIVNKSTNRSLKLSSSTQRIKVSDLKTGIYQWSVTPRWQNFKGVPSSEVKTFELVGRERLTSPKINRQTATKKGQ